MVSFVARTALAGRKVGYRTILVAAAVGSLSGCVSNDQKPMLTSELGDPVAVTVAAVGTDEDGQQVALKVPLPGERPNVAVAALASEAEPAAAQTASEVTAIALVPTRRVGGTISGSAAIDRMIEEAAAENGVPRELAFAVVHVESRYNPKAKGAGVYGLSQIMPATARSLGFSGPAEGLFDPATNLRYGMKYLKGAWEKGGRDICQASMKYKGGHRATRMTKSAATYCANVKRHIASITGRVVDTAPIQVAAVAEPAKLPGVVVPARSPIAAAVALAPLTVAASTTVSAGTAIAAQVDKPVLVVVPAEAAKPTETEAETIATATVLSQAPAEGKAGRSAVAETVAAAADETAPDPSRFGG